MRLKIFVATLSCLLVACGGSGGEAILDSFTAAYSPQVISTSPAKRTPIVEGVATNSMVIAQFSRNMLASTINATSFTVTCTAGTPVPATVTYDATTRIAKLIPTDLLTSGATCEAKVSTAVTDTVEIPLAADYVWTFTIGGADSLVHAGITSRSPALNETDEQCSSKSISVTFDEPMDPTTITAANFYVTGPGIGSTVKVPGAITYDMTSNTATFAVTNPPGYTAGTYTTTVTTGVKDLAGNSALSANTATFIVGTTACDPGTTVSLGTIAPFGAFGGNAGITNSGINTVVVGDLGTTAACTLFTGFHDGLYFYTETPLNKGKVTGDIYCDSSPPEIDIATKAAAAADALIAYNALAAKTPTTTLDTGELGGRTLLPATYKPAAATLLLSTGNLTLDAAGDANAMWVFQISESLTVGLPAISRRVFLINGAQAKNVFWQVGSAARIEDGSTMVGTIIARAGVTISTAGQTVQTNLIGRAIGLNASVTMVNTTIVVP